MYRISSAFQSRHDAFVRLFLRQERRRRDEELSPPKRYGNAHHVRLQAGETAAKNIKNLFHSQNYDVCRSPTLLWRKFIIWGMSFLSHLTKIQKKSIWLFRFKYRRDFFGLRSSYSRLWTTGLFRGGAGAQPAGLRLQSERRERVQHGPVHPATGRGRACSQRRPDTCEIFLLVCLSPQFEHTAGNLPLNELREQTWRGDWLFL